VLALVPDPDRAQTARRRRSRGWSDAELAARWPTCGTACPALTGAARPADPALAAEARDVARRLGGSLRAWAGRGTAALLLMAAAGALRAQAPSPEALYAEGSLAAAADGFSRRAGSEPTDPAHWYNSAPRIIRGSRAPQRPGFVRGDCQPRSGRRQAPGSRRPTRCPLVDLEPSGHPEELCCWHPGWLAGWLGWAALPGSASAGQCCSSSRPSRRAPARDCARGTGARSDRADRTKACGVPRLAPPSVRSSPGARCVLRARAGLAAGAGAGGPARLDRRRA
jgi:hypothetical protein